MEDKTITLSKHEVVVDRDWVESIGRLLLEAGHAEVGQVCVDMGEDVDAEEIETP